MKLNSTILSICCSLFSMNSFAALDLNSPECQSFTKVVNGEREDLEKGLQTDQIIVTKNGAKVFSWDDGVYTLDKKHPLWSASSTITATIVGAAIQKGDLKIDARLKDFFPLKIKDSVQQFYYDQITIDHLLSMSSGFLWNEVFEKNLNTSAFMNMLYGPDQYDMNLYALTQPLEMSPGLKWNYNEGNSVILMAILRQIYGHEHFAEDLLFKPLKMQNAFFEKDNSGNLIGSSYAYMTPDEMQKIGQLYLNDGMADDIRILPKAWIRKAQVPADSLSRSDTKSDPAYVANKGVFSQRAFWLNQNVKSVKMESEFKNSPRDMFFAAGNYGQLIIVLPTQNLVITTSGHNKEYKSKIDKLVSNAVACFSTKAPLISTETNSESNTDMNTPNSKKFDFSSLPKGYSQAIFAKEICSCHFIAELTVEQCLEHSNLPMSAGQLNKVNYTVDEDFRSVKVKPSIAEIGLSFGKAHAKEASYFGENEGCRLNP